MAKKSGVCAFCGRKAVEVRLLIQGIEAEICDNCAEQAYAIVKEQLGNDAHGFDSNFFPSPNCSLTMTWACSAQLSQISASMPWMSNRTSLAFRPQNAQTPDFFDIVKLVS